jgi:hypothetical protein
VFWAGELEGARVRLLGILGSVGPARGFFAEPPETRVFPDIQARIAASRTARARSVAAEGRVGVDVLAYVAKNQIAIIGAGRDSGVDVLDPVVVPAGLLGFVDAVEPNLARVRLLSASKARVPVTLAESRSGLPGEVVGLNAVLEGTGSGGRLVEGPLLSEFRAGDRLHAVIDRAASPPLAVGTVAKPGLLPEVRLAAGPGDLGLVAVPADREPSRALFVPEALEVRAESVFGRRGALLAAPDGSSVAAGCAVHARGRYLGRITRVAGRTAVASRLDDRGHRVFVRLLGASAAAPTGQLVSAGGGSFRLEIDDAQAVPAGPLLAVTAGGEHLVPGDLAIGFLDPDAADFRLRDPVAPWPPEVTASVFLFGAELERLLPP